MVETNSNGSEQATPSDIEKFVVTNVNIRSFCDPILKISHYWLIPEPNGPSSLGKCKKCGEEREFLNGSADSDAWERRNGVSEGIL